MPYNLRKKKDFTDSVLDVRKPTGQAMKFDHIIREIREVTFRVGGSPLESTNPRAVPCHTPSPAHEPWKTPSRSLLAKGRPGLRLVARGGLGSTSSRLGWAGPTEMQWWGSSGGKKERVSSKDPRSLRKYKDWEPEPGRESIFFY